MKFHLPKKLMVAVLAAMACIPNYATTVVPGIVDTYTEDTTLTALPGYMTETAEIVTPSTYTKGYVKDGSGTLSISGVTGIAGAGVEVEVPLYVREGKMEIKDSIIYAKPSQNPVSMEGRDSYVSVAGNNSELLLDNTVYRQRSTDATYPELADSTIDNGAYLNIGGPDGSGTLTLKNNSDMRCNYSIVAGFHKYGSWSNTVFVVNSTNTTIDPSSERYANGAYNYVEAQDRYFGTATINVESGSKLISKVSIVLADATLNIDGAGSLVKSGAYYGDPATHSYVSAANEGGATILARQNGGTTNVNITNGGKMESLHTVGGYGTSTNTTLNILVAGADENGNASNLHSMGTLQLGSWPGSATNRNITMKVLEGGLVSANEILLGDAHSNGGNEVAKVTIDEKSSMKATSSCVLGSGSTVNNRGSVEASNISITGGTLSMSGARSSVTSDDITVADGGTLEAAGGAPIEVDSDVTVEDGGVISLKDGSTLAVTGTLTMGTGSILRLSANDYAAGDTLLSSGNGDLDVADATVEVAGGQANYIIKDGTIIITAVFDNSIAEALTVTNWGIATASRTFVNAVRGQRTNTGCIADGRGTAWAAVLGATSDIGSGDVDLKGAAVGADMKVGEKSSLGVAFGYIDGDAKIPGMSKAEQEGTYVALYGEHGLKKLSATSCLSLDWVAAYGQTDTEWESADWEQQSLQLNTRLNWNKKVTDRLCMSVFGGLEYFTSESDRVENAKTGSIQNLRGEIGVGARYVAWGTPGSQPVLDEKGATLAAARPGCEKLVLHGEIRYMNDMVRSNPVIEQDGLRGSGDNPGRQGMGIEAGATYRISERWSASANYGFNTMEDSKEHRVNVGASYTF